MPIADDPHIPVTATAQPRCLFSRIGGQIVCHRCGKEYEWAADRPFPVRNCGAAPAGPHLMLRALNFAKAVFTQAPLVAEAILTSDEAKAFRSQAEIEAIAKVCKACPLFNGKVCTHKNCGCPVDAERNAWWSKIAWKSQRCPANPPRW